MKFNLITVVCLTISSQVFGYVIPTGTKWNDYPFGTPLPNDTLMFGTLITNKIITYTNFVQTVSSNVNGVTPRQANIISNAATTITLTVNTNNISLVTLSTNVNNGATNIVVKLDLANTNSGSGGNSSFATNSTYSQFAVTATNVVGPLNANNLTSGTVPLTQLSGITSNQLDATTWQLATNSPPPLTTAQSNILASAVTNNLGGRRVFYVSTNGNDSTAQTNNLSLTWASFAKVTSLATNDTDDIFILPGNYNITNIYLAKGVLFEGYSRDSVILTQTNYGASQNASLISAFQPLDNCTLRNFTWFVPTNGGYGNQYASFLLGTIAASVTNVVVQNVHLLGQSDVFFNNSVKNNATNTQTRFGVKIENSVIECWFDFLITANPAPLSGTLFSENNVWIRHAVGNTAEMVAYGFQFNDAGSTFNGFGETGSSSEFAGNISLHGSIFINNPAGFLPLFPNNYGQVSGDYVDADSGKIYSLAPDRCSYVAMATNAVLWYGTNVIIFSGSAVSSDNTYFYWNSILGSFTNSNGKCAGIVADSGQFWEVGNIPLISLSGNADYYTTANGTVTNYNSFVNDLRGKVWQVYNASGPATTTTLTTNNYSTNYTYTVAAMTNSSGFVGGTFTGNGGGLTNVPLTALQNNTNNTLVITNGKVGIGTTAPAQNLQIVGNALVTSLYTSNTIGGVSIDGGASLQLQNLSGDLAIRGVNGGTGIRFDKYDDSVTWMKIGLDGKVGIGTTSPATALQVVGTVTASGYSSLATNNTVSTAATYTMTSAGFTNLNTKIVRVLGYSGTSVVFTNLTSGYGCAIGTIAAGTGYFELQTNECLKGTAMAATGIVDK